jgi:dolichyl-phosphate beta-glucosyltransferase
VKVALQHAQNLASNDDLKVLKLAENRGKGGAVKQGVKAARGKYILMLDADGATDITALPRLYREVRRIQTVNTDIRGSSEPLGITIGSRAHLEEKSVATRAFYRTILMRGFHLLVTLLCTQNIRDTQCGFKLFTREAGKLLFDSLHLESWAFDIELIYMAERLGIPMSEVAVTWEEVDGSKLIQSKADVVVTSLNMARDMLTVRVAYMLGLWKMR